MPCSLDVIVPVFNPPPGWETGVAERFSAFQKLLSGKVQSVALTLVNDGSTQNTEAENFQKLIAQLPEVQVVSYAQNRGKGFALRAGVAATEADFYLLTDADFPYTMDSMTRLADCLLAHGGVAAGNRDTAYYGQVPFLRKVISKCLRWLLRHVIGLSVTDSQCGLKGFDRAGRTVFLRTTIDRFLFDLEFLMLASRTLVVRPVSVELRPGVVFSRVGIGVLVREAFNFIKLLKVNWFR